MIRKCFIVALVLAIALPTVVFCQDVDPAIQKELKKYVKTTGNFKKAEGENIVIYRFSVEYVYKKYTTRVGDQKQIGNITQTTVADGYQKLEMSEEAYRNLTDAIYDSFVNAMEEYAGKTVISKGLVVENALYKELGGKHKVDTSDKFFSGRRGINVKTGSKGSETLKLAPTGMKVMKDTVAFKWMKVARLAGELGGDMLMDVKIFVDFEKKTDTPYIRESNVTINTGLKARQKKLPGKGAVEGEFVYEWRGPTLTIELKKPITTGVKVTDRRTGFFAQLSGTYGIDQYLMSKSIVETYQTLAIMQALKMAGY